MPNDAPRTVLIAEDDQDIRETTALLLQRRGWTVRTAANGQLALDDALQRQPDIALVDVAMPVMDGYRLTAMLKRMAVPVVMLTARDLPSDVVSGLGSGADDYVTKPFDADVLDARLRAVLRRPTAQAADVEQLDEVQIDRAGQTVRVRGVEVPVTATEWRLITVLLDFRGRVLTREQLLDHVWPELDDDSVRVVDTNVQRLRKKLPELRIATVRGTGYRLDGR